MMKLGFVSLMIDNPKFCSRSLERIILDGGSRLFRRLKDRLFTQRASPLGLTIIEISRFVSVHNNKFIPI